MTASSGLPAPQPISNHLLSHEIHDVLPPRTLNFEISDDVSPNDFIIKEIRKLAGNHPITGSDHVKVDTQFDKSTKGDVKIYLFNNQGIIQYYFIKQTKVKLNLVNENGIQEEVTLNFSKKTYTNVEPPKSFNSALHEERSAIALMSASVFSEIETDALRHQLGLPTTMKHQVDERIRNDVVKKGFLALALFSGKDMVVGNQSPGFFERLKGKHGDTNLKGRMITHARFAFVEEKSKGKEEHAETPKIKYKTIDLHLIQTAHSTMKQETGESRFALQMNENAPSYLREIANIHNAALLNRQMDELIESKAEVDKKNGQLIEILQNAKINKNIYWSLLNSENEKLHTKLNRQYALLSRLDFLDELIREYDPEKIGALSPTLQEAIYPKKKKTLEKIKSQFSKEKYEPFQLFNRLQVLYSSKEFEGEDQETLAALLTYCERTHQKMRDLNQEMKKNEGYLGLIANLNNARVERRSPMWDEVIQEKIFNEDEEDFFVY